MLVQKVGPVRNRILGRLSVEYECPVEVNTPGLANVAAVTVIVSCGFVEFAVQIYCRFDPE